MKKYNRLNPIHWLLSLFSNSNETEYLKEVPWYRPEEYTATRRIKWFFRNPVHDFMAYIIGFEEERKLGEFVTIYGPAETLVYGSTFFAIHQYKWMKLPYFSSWQFFDIQFYIGWRPSGMFGIKCRRSKPDA